MLWKAQPDDELENKGHDENHTQFTLSFSFVNTSNKTVL